MFVEIMIAGLFTNLNSKAGRILLAFIFATLYSPLGVVYSFAQHNPPINFSSFSTSNGLSQNSASHILQDSDGIMWIATQVGIDRYDGVDFSPVKNFEKKLTEEITYLYNLNEEHLLVSTSDSAYFIRKKYITSVPIKKLSFPREILFIDKLQDQSFLVFTKTKIYTAHNIEDCTLLDSTSFNANAITCVGKYQQDNNNIYFIGTENGLFRWDWDQTTNIKLIRINSKIKKVTALCTDKINQKIYVGSELLTFYTIDFLNPNLEKDSIPLSPADNNILSSSISVIHLEKGDSSILWLGTKNSGLYRYDLIQEKQIACHANCRSHVPPINDNQILCITSSNDGVLWVGLYAGGINYLRNGKPQFQNLYRGEYIGIATDPAKDTVFHYNNYTHCILPLSTDRLLAGTPEEGIALINLNNDFIQKRIAPNAGNNLNSRKVNVLKEKPDDNNIYIGTDAGVYYMDKTSVLNNKKSNTYQPTAFTSKSVSIMEYNPYTRQWWVSSRRSGSIYILEEDFSATIQNLFIGQEKEYISFIQHINSKENNFTLVGTTKGLFRIDSETADSKPIKYKAIKAHAISSYIPKENHYIWLGTDRGKLYKLDLLEDKVVDSLELTGREREVIYAILGDHFGNQWISSNHGIYLVNLDKKLINHYGVKDGLLSDEFNSGVYAIGPDSTLFFGGVLGINAYKPLQDFFNQTAENADLILSYQYPRKKEKKEFLFLKREPSPKIKLPFRFRYLKISPILTSYQDPQNNQFRLKVNNSTNYIYPGDNGEFVLTEDDLEVNIPFLTANKIQLEYRTANSDWNPGYEIAVYRSLVTWQNLLYLLVVLTGVLLIIYLFRTVRKWQNFSGFQEKINEISRLELRTDVVEKALVHFTRDFNFDYAAFYPVDFYERKISFDRSRFRNTEESTSTNERQNYSLEDDNIICQVARKRSMAIVLGNQILEQEFNPKGAFDESSLDPFAYKIYIPVIHRSLKSDGEKEDNASNETAILSEDITLGVLEAGSRQSRIQLWVNQRLKTTPIIKKFSIREQLQGQKVKMELYADNFAQPYYRAYLKEKRNELYELAETLENDHAYEDHFEFIREVMHKMAALIQARYGNVSFKSFNDQRLNFQEKEIFFGFNLQENNEGYKKYGNRNENKKGIIQHVAETKKLYYTGDVLNDPYYIRVFDSVQSELALPMLNENRFLVGVINFGAERMEHFNQIHAYSLKKGVEKATNIFLKKKSYNTLKELAKPYDVFTQKSLYIYQNAVASLKNYFDAQYIAVWERDIQQERTFKLSEATPAEFRTMYEKTRFTTATTKRNTYEERLGDQVVRIQHLEDYKNKKSSVYTFCQEHGFKSYVILNIIIDNRFEAFINIFSKRRIEENAGEFTIYSAKLLEQIAKKVSLAVQSNKLFRSIEEISKSLSAEQGNPLEVITQQAYELLPSASIVLIPNKALGELNVSDAIYAGDIKDIEKKQGKKAYFASWILNNGTQFIDSAEKYIEIIQQIPKEEKIEQEDDFWNLHGIKAVAAIRLSYQGKHLGVMIFNYKYQKVFDEEAKRIIRAFTNLATTSLLNEQFISRIKSETEKLAVQTQELMQQSRQLEQEKKNIEFEYDKVFKKMEEMLPNATRTSYFLILQGVNHDVRNYLLKMQAQFLKIEKFITSHNKAEYDEILKGLNLNVENINNLLSLFDFRETTVKESIHVNEVTRQVISFFKNQQSWVKFHLTFAGNMPNLICHKAEFSMILYNLVNNAIQAIPEEEEEGKIIIETKFEDKMFIISVQDNGEGIDKESLDKIFDFGFSTKEKGIGIGLYFVKKVIEEHFYGTITVKSQKGKMTIMTIQIPEYINYLN